MLCRKCRKLLLNKYIHPFWVKNGTIDLKTFGNGQGYVVTHRNNLEELSRDYEVSANQV